MSTIEPLIIKLAKLAEGVGANQILATFVLANLTKLGDIDIRDLAKRTNTTPSSVSRFIQKIGLRNFKELKYALKTLVNGLNNNLLIMPSFQAKLVSITELITKNFTAWQTSIDFNQLAKLIVEAKLIYIFAQGGGASIAGDFCYRLQRLGYLTITTSDPVYQAMLIKTTTKQTNALFILLSQTGNTPTIVDAGKKLVDQQLSFISITNHYQNQLNQLSTYQVVIFDELVTDLKGLMGSHRIILLLLVDLIIDHVIDTQHQVQQVLATVQ